MYVPNKTGRYELNIVKFDIVRYCDKTSCDPSNFIKSTINFEVPSAKRDDNIKLTK